jgi:hypothetical protein
MLCPPGTTMRKSYTRRFKSTTKEEGYTVRRKGKLYLVKPKVNSVHVSAQCVKKAVTRTARFGSELRKGDLIKYGYQFRLSDSVRHKALQKAINAYGLKSVIHKLDAIVKLTAHAHSDANKIFLKDYLWLKQLYKNEKREHQLNENKK